LRTLTAVGFHATAVKDLSPLKVLRDLRQLDLRATLVTDLSPLRENRNLRVLDFDEAPGTDLSPLFELYNLRTVNDKPFAQFKATHDVDARCPVMDYSFSTADGQYHFRVNGNLVRVYDGSSHVREHKFDNRIQFVYPNPAYPIVALSLCHLPRYDIPSSYLLFPEAAPEASDWVLGTGEDYVLERHGDAIWSPDGRHAAFWTGEGAAVVETTSLRRFAKTGGKEAVMGRVVIRAMAISIVRWESQNTLLLQDASCGEVWQRRYNVTSRQTSRRRCVAGGCTRRNKGRIYYIPDQIEITYTSQDEQEPLGGLSYDQRLRIDRGIATPEDQMEYQAEQFYHKMISAIAPCARRVSPEKRRGFDITFTSSNENPSSTAGCFSHKKHGAGDREPSAPDALMTCVEKAIDRLSPPSPFFSKPLKIEWPFVIQTRAESTKRNPSGC
jgi:hypothetical protein